MRSFGGSVLRPFPIISNPGARRRALLQGRHHAAYSTGQRVHVRRPWSPRTRVIKFVAYSMISYLSLRYLVGRFVEPLDEVSFGDDDKHKNKSDDSRSAAQDDGGVLQEGAVVQLDEDDATFIALQYPKQLPRTYYKGSDPEWQEFVRLSRDTERTREVRKQLADKTVEILTQNPRWAVLLGGEIKWKKYWLDFYFPEGPPPEYSRTGLLILDEEIALSQEVMPHAQYLSLRNILRPVALWRALKASAYQTYSIQAIKVKKALGMELSTPEKRLDVSLELIKMRALAQVKEKDMAEAQQQVRGKVKRLGPVGGETRRRQQSDEAESTRSSENPLTAGFPVSLGLALSSHTFLHELVRNWKAESLDKEPAGCCYLFGDVEVYGAHGRAKIAVVATYDPKANKFVWILPKGKHHWKKSQAPRGGQ